MNIDIKILTKILKIKSRNILLKEDNTSGLDGVYSGSEEFNIWKSVNNSSINRLKKKRYHHFRICRKSIYKIKHMFLTKTLSQVDL